MAADYHQPVMLAECLEGLNLKEDGQYVDVTFGGGGHSRAVVERLTTGHLYGLDQDPDAKANAEGMPADRFTLVAGNFRHLQRLMRAHRVEKIDGLLADLGVSSHQINSGERGFSTRFDGPLDMRMNPAAPTTAAEVLASYSAAELQTMFSQYGEVKNARTLAQRIVEKRHIKPLEQVEQLLELLEPLAPRRKEYRYQAQVFQALRMEVNGELDALKELLAQATALLKPNGRLVVMSYHSLEDRLVKNWMRTGNTAGELNKDFYGNVMAPMKEVTRKPIVASAEEIETNNRARSAKLRVGEKLPNGTE